MRSASLQGDYVRCDPRDSGFTEKQRENWRSLKSVVQIIKTQHRR